MQAYDFVEHLIKVRVQCAGLNNPYIKKNMYLKQLKLAGFKSFVDVTVIELSSPIMAIVGPNGCGKSNVMEAICWVMGESSVKHLRSQSMTDVIFKGTHTRRAAGQALVELTFSNEQGRIQGPFSQYQEIAIKRIVTRDNDSTFYINNTPCRRRDVIEMFLGTGIGARTYAVISQGMINHIIEARPQELKRFFEEAAGVSRYKTRRQETLQRLEQTEQNLTRVQDIKQALNEQVKRLSLQAQAAQRYQALKQQEADSLLAIHALKWQEATHAYEAAKAQEASLSIAYIEQEQAVDRQAHDLALHVAQHTKVASELKEYTTQLHQADTAAALLDANIKQAQKDEGELVLRVERITHAQNLLKQDLKNTTTRCTHIDSRLSDTKASLATLTHTLKDMLEQQQALKPRQDTLAQTLDALQEAHHQGLKAQQMATLEYQHLTNQQTQDQQTLDESMTMQSRLEQQDLTDKLDVAQINTQKIHALEEDIARFQTICQRLQTSLNHALQQQQQTLEQQTQVSYELQKEVAALNAFIHARQSDSLPKTQASMPRVLDLLHVEPAWQLACERVLGESLYDHVVTELTLTSCTPPANQVVSISSTIGQNSAIPLTRLSTKLHRFVPFFLPYLASIYTANSWEEACIWQPYLQENESIITADGTWLAQGFCRLAPQQLKHETVLAKQARLVVLKADIAAIDLTAVQGNIATFKALMAQSRAYAQAITTLALKWQKIGQSQTMHLNKLTLNQAHRRTRLTELHKTTAPLTKRLAQTKASILALGHKARRLKEENDARERQKMALKHQKTVSEADYFKQQQAHAACTNKLAKLKEQKAQDEADHRALRQVISRFEQQNKAYDVELAELHAKQNTLKKTQKTQATTRIKAQKTKLALLKQCKLTNTKLEQIQRLEQSASQALEKARTTLVTLKQTHMHASWALKEAATMLENLQQTHDSEALKACLSTLVSSKTITYFDKKLKNIHAKITNLGAINLVALDEYTTLNARKITLDEQCDDLNEAIALLKQAITQMDKTSSMQFKTAFDDIKQRFEHLFKHLFSGGEANLYLNDTMDAETTIGISVTPPGKRTTALALLSGGEKAMTALALVFAIFERNPAPFCVLDEIDAPLDEANVHRLSQLIRKMSAQVQFLLITHNKFTMVQAHHLIGVTMQEPGISRIVSVNVEDALSLCE